MAKGPIKILSVSLLQNDKHTLDAVSVITARGRRSLRYALTVMSTICFLLSYTSAVSAQTDQPTVPFATTTASTDLTTVKDFRVLFAERAKLLDEIRNLDQAVEDLQAKLRNLRSVEVLEADVKKAETVLKRLMNAASTPPTEKQQSDIDTQDRYVDQINQNLQTIKDSKPILDANKADQVRKRERLLAIEQRIAALFDATRDENQFRLYATITFGALVLIVVGGFYLIAWNKEGVATTIFAGELGMQFITLFLIVIAIILFGIMGILEGKELSALLGGLSGYILGRAGSKRSEGPPTDPNQNRTNQRGDTRTEEAVT